jgi:hypothetical protein
MKYILLFIALMSTSYAQYMSIPVYEDTAALKLSKESGIVFLKQNSGSDQTGGGFFMRIDSAYAEGTYAFDSKQTGMQWLRMGYPNSYFLNATIGTLTTSSISGFATTVSPTFTGTVGLPATALTGAITQSDSSKGLILKDSAGKKWHLKVSPIGTLAADSTGLN